MIHWKVIGSYLFSIADGKGGRRWFAKDFFVIFAPVALIFGGTLVFFEYNLYQAHREVLAKSEAVYADIARKHISKELKTVTADLMYLAESEPLGELIEDNTSEAKARVARVFSNLSKHRKLYDQIRYLDEAGQEVVRVNFNRGKIDIVPDEKLQNKSRRYYFTDAFKLTKGQVFVSPLDLNIERGQIERPLKPVLRIGTPLFDHRGEKRGIVLLNYFGTILIERLGEALRGASGDAMFLNREGYWFLAPDPAQEWGFMLGRNHTLAQKNPEVWSTISSQERGQFWTDEGSLFTFETVYPLLEGYVSSSGAAAAFASSDQEIEAKDYFWKIVLELKPEILGNAHDHVDQGLLVYLIFLLCMVPGAILLAHARARNRIAEEALRLTKFSVDHAADSVFWLDPDGRIAYVNEAACRSLGYSKSDLLSMTVHDIDPRFPAEGWPQHWQEIRKRGSFTLESCHRAKDGKEYPVEVMVNCLRYGDREYNCAFARDITERKRYEAEREALHKQFLKASREAGMAEIAIGVLHNVGNVLNSVNVSTTLVKEKIRSLRIAGLVQLAHLLQEQAGNMATFLTEDPKGKQLPRYISALSENLSTERDKANEEIGSLLNNVEHIKQIVAIQQSYAVPSGVMEAVSIPELVNDALKMNVSSRHSIEIVREYQELPIVLLDKHKLIQIVVNLLRNAKQSLNQRGCDKKMTVRVLGKGKNTARIEVEDNGIGISSKNLNRVFEYGFSTKAEGHGVGLHASAIAAKNMGGSLTYSSKGPGKGATFILELPLNVVEKVA